MPLKPERKPALAVLVLVPLAGLLVVSSAGAAPVVVQSSWGATLSCVADAAGYCVVRHPAGVVPDDVVVTPTTPAITSVDLRTATTFRVRFYRAIAPNGTVTALPGAHMFGVHIDWGARPSPTPGGGPRSSASPPSPPPNGFPDARNTGVPAGTVLKTVNNDIRITTANTVIDSQDIHGCVLVQAPGAVIRRSRITCRDYISVMSKVDDYSGTGVLLEDDEITCGDGSGTAIGDTNITARRLNVHGCENGFDVDATVTVQDSYIHDLWSGGDAHADGIQLALGHDVTIKHNTIYSDGGTSSIISPNAGASNVLIEHNLMSGGAYTLYCQQTGSGTNFRVINNHFSRRFHPTAGAYGPSVYCDDESVVTGNVWDDTRLPVAMT